MCAVQHAALHAHGQHMVWHVVLIQTKEYVLSTVDVKPASAAKNEYIPFAKEMMRHAAPALRPVSSRLPGKHLL